MAGTVPHDNSGQRWSDEDVLTLRHLLEDGVPAAELADVLGRSGEAIAYMTSRLRSETAAELRCARCGQLQPAAHFRPSQRHTGGYCTSCARAYERGTEQIEALRIEG